MGEKLEVRWRNTMTLLNRYRHWFWVFDPWFVVSVCLLVVFSVVVAVVAAGMLITVDDPDAAMVKRREKSITDFSLGVQLEVIPDKPVGVEFRKVGEDEDMLLFEEGK